jgi:hypothetical protein
MQSEEKKLKNVLLKLSEIAEIYKVNVLESSGVKKDFYKNLITTTNLIFEKIKLVKKAKQKIDPNNDSTETDSISLEIPEDENIFSKFKYHNFGLDEVSERFLKHLCGFIHLYMEDNIFDAPVEFLAEIIFHNVLWWHFGNHATLRCDSDKTEAEILTYALSLKELKIPYMSDYLWEILEERQKSGKISLSKGQSADTESQKALWIQLFNNQERHNTIFTIGKELKIALQYIYDPVVEKFFNKKLDLISEYRNICLKKKELLLKKDESYMAELIHMPKELQRQIEFSEYKLVVIAGKYYDLTNAIDYAIKKTPLQKSDIKKIAEKILKYLAKTKQLDIVKKIDPYQPFSDNLCSILERIIKLHNKGIIRSVLSELFSGFEQIHTSFCEEQNKAVDIRKISEWIIYLINYRKQEAIKDQQPSV